jgi:hypothetical protein
MAETEELKEAKGLLAGIQSFLKGDKVDLAETEAKPEDKEKADLAAVLEDGEYELRDGRVLVIVDGMPSEVKEKEAPTEEEEAEMADKKKLEEEEEAEMAAAKAKSEEEKTEMSSVITQLTDTVKELQEKVTLSEANKFNGAPMKAKEKEVTHEEEVNGTSEFTKRLKKFQNN